MSTCHRLAIPIFVGAAADGSIFLNSMKLWAMKQAGLMDSYKFELDLHAEVYEACAYHRWGLFDNPPNALGTLILGGGVPKNYNLQPEPALGQVLGLPNVRGYNFDVQIVTAPVTDGSLSSCPPAEAVTWGKVDKDTYQSGTESMQADYSTVMPFLVKALLDNRRRYEKLAAELGDEEAFRREPKARGYLRPRAGYRLYENREELVRPAYRGRENQSRVAPAIPGICPRPPIRASETLDCRQNQRAQVPRDDYGKHHIDPCQQAAPPQFPAVQP